MWFFPAHAEKFDTVTAKIEGIKGIVPLVSVQLSLFDAVDEISIVGDEGCVVGMGQNVDGRRSFQVAPFENQVKVLLHVIGHPLLDELFTVDGGYQMEDVPSFTCRK